MRAAGTLRTSCDAKLVPDLYSYANAYPPLASFPPNSCLARSILRIRKLWLQTGRFCVAKNSINFRFSHEGSLDFLENAACIRLEKKMSARLPNKSARRLLYGLVLDGQCDRANSGLPAREDASVWDPTARVLLQHTEDDKELKIRPYFTSTMEVTKCHGDEVVLGYVATYSLKFSDSIDQCRLSEASDHAARRLLFSCHPLKPEMLLTLAAKRFAEESKPKWLQNYEESSWRSESILDMFGTKLIKMVTSSATFSRAAAEMCPRQSKMF